MKILEGSILGFVAIFSQFGTSLRMIRTAVVPGQALNVTEAHRKTFQTLKNIKSDFGKYQTVISLLLCAASEVVILSTPVALI